MFPPNKKVYALVLMKKSSPDSSRDSPSGLQGFEFASLSVKEQGEILQLQHAILSSVTRGAPHKEVINEICLLAEQLLPNSVASVMLMDEANEFLNVYVAPHIPPEGISQLNRLRPGPGAGSCGNVLYRQKAQFVSNTFTDPRWSDLRELAYNFNLCSCWSVPIYSASNQITGTFALSSFEHREPTPFYSKLLEICAAIIGIVLDRNKSQESLLESEEKLRGLYELSPLGIALTDMTGRFLEFNESFRQICGYSEDELKAIDYWALTPRKYESEEAHQLEILTTTGRYGPYEKEYIRKDGSLVSLRLNGILLTDRNGRKYIWSIVEDITERKKAELEVWTQANFDQLTQLPNRRLFTDRLEQELKKAERDKYLTALLFIDIDHFKEINDTMGHEVGDLLLIEASRRIKHCVRETDTVARLGGDEFTIILSELTDNFSDVERIAQKILNHLSEPFTLKDQERFLSASIGISIYPHDATSVTDLLKFADQAMYVAKNQGRNCFRFFTKAMQENSESRTRMANDLRHALKASQLDVYYQPIVDLANGQTHKAEALVRWKHPQCGFVPPATFIPIAEHTGIIHEIGSWVFMQAARQVQRLQSELGMDFQISVNKSPLQFRDETSNYVPWPDSLKKLGLSGTSIAVEITEGMLMDNSEIINRRLLELRDAGMQISLDDFGTGYSSLSYLKKFDIDYLKIDQSFTRNLSPLSEDMALCEAIIVMAHKLDIKVIAEGVETEEQKHLLIEAGCDYGQGYLFSRPVPSKEFEVFLASH